MFLQVNSVREVSLFIVDSPQLYDASFACDNDESVLTACLDIGQLEMSGNTVELKKRKMIGFAYRLTSEFSSDVSDEGKVDGMVRLDLPKR